MRADVFADPRAPRRELRERHGSQGQVRCTGSLVVLTRQRRLPFLHVLPTLVEDLLDIVGRSYDGVDYVVLGRRTRNNTRPRRE